MSGTPREEEARGTVESALFFESDVRCLGKTDEGLDRAVALTAGAWAAYDVLVASRVRAELADKVRAIQLLGLSDQCTPVLALLTEGAPTE